MMYADNECQDCFTYASFCSSDGVAARESRRDFAGAISKKGFSEVDVANAEIVFGELCGNIARHAPGSVDVMLEFRTAQATLHIMDRGLGFSTLGRRPIDALAETGRGLLIVASMTVKFSVVPRPGGGSHARATLIGRSAVCRKHDSSRESADLMGIAHAGGYVHGYAM